MDLIELLKLRDEEDARIVNLILDDYEINTPLRKLHFLNQVLFETANFTKLVENLNYTTPERIAKVWPSRFNLDGSKGKKNAKLYTRNPQKLANEVYANRMGNGSPESGHGWKYRGRGAMHLTGLNNYKKASYDIFGDDRLVVSPDLVSDDIIVAIATAAWFWKINGLNAVSDRNDLSTITKRVNGSTATVSERGRELAKLKTQFNPDEMIA